MAEPAAAPRAIPDAVPLKAGPAGPLLFLIGQLRAGGQEQQLYYLLRELARGGVAARLAVWNFDPEEPWVQPIAALGVPIDDLAGGRGGGGGRGRGGRPAKILRLRKLIRATGARVVHSYSFYTNFGAWAAAAGTACVAVGSIRSTLAKARRDSGRVLGFLSARFPRFQIANSRGAQREAAATGAPASVQVVRNGVDFDRFRASPLPAGIPLLLGVGSLIAVKKWERFLETAEALASRGLAFRAAIAGDGPLRAWLSIRLRRAGLDDRFTLLGDVRDVPDALARASVLVHTSDVEGSPNAVIEAMACGRPVVAWHAGDVRDLVQEEVEGERTGFVVSSAGALTERLATLIAEPDLRRRLGLAARVRAEKEFDLSRLTSETLDAYRAAGWRE